MSLASTIGQTAPGTDGPSTTPTTNKRGRKPGPLSKSAREAQRRLNHSIIEKARRTKINDALATLKQLVPPDYLQTRETQKAAAGGIDNNVLDDGADEDLDDDDEGGEEEGPGDDPEYRERNNRTLNNKQSKLEHGAKGGKKQEKEKEFKLEILVRTVVFLQDLLERVDHLEAAVSSSKTNSDSSQHCATCGNTIPPASSPTTSTNDKKRKRASSSSSSTPTTENAHDAPHGHKRVDNHSRPKIARTTSGVVDPQEAPPTPRISPQRQRAEKHITLTGAQSPKNTAPASPSSSSSSSAEKRLPSISSWLTTDAYPHILPSPLSFGTFVGTVGGKEVRGVCSDSASTSNLASSSPSYLPSPPSSTHCFDPIRTYTSTQVPFLNLGPGATTPIGMATSSSMSSKPLSKPPAPTSRAPTAQAPSSAPPTPLALTPEDESAASMLLHIASSSSPQFRPINPSSSSNTAKSTTTSPIFPGYRDSNNVNVALPEPTQFSLYSSNSHSHPHPQPHLQPPHPHSHHPRQPASQRQHHERSNMSIRQVETPSSILGIRKY